MSRIDAGRACGGGVKTEGYRSRIEFGGTKGTWSWRSCYPRSQKRDLGHPPVMIRENRQMGFIVAFDFTLDAEREVRRFAQKEGREIKLMTVRDLLDVEPAALPSKKQVASEPLPLFAAKGVAGR